MSEITKALLLAFASLLHPRMLLLLLWPVLVALVLWLGLAFAFWSQAAAWLQSQFGQTAAIDWAITVWPLSLIAGGAEHRRVRDARDGWPRGRTR